ncbi:hypothetical protein V6N13_009164 [Hibiscus sabdariffa]
MRLIVHLQSVVQGRGDLFFGSFIPCTLFYFLQLYYKRHPSHNPRSSHSPTLSSPMLTELMRTSSCFNRFSHGSIGKVWISSRAISIAKPNYLLSGWRRYRRARLKNLVTRMEIFSSSCQRIE